MPQKAHKGYNQNKSTNNKSRNSPGAVHKKGFSGVPVGRPFNPVGKEICIFESNTPVAFEDVLSNMQTNTNFTYGEIKVSPVVRGKVISSMKRIISRSENPIQPLVKVVLKSTPSNRVHPRVRRKEDRLTSRGELIVQVKSPIVKDEENLISFLKETRKYNPSTRRTELISASSVEIVREKVWIVPHNSKLDKRKKLSKHIQENFKISSKLAIKLKKSLIDDSQLKKLSVDEIGSFFQRSFFGSLGFYQSLIVRNGIKKYYVYKDDEFDFYIDMIISKKFPIRINNKEDVYEELYKELFDFLENGNIRIGKFGKLIREEKSIVIQVNKDLQSSKKLTPVKSKKLLFKKNEK